MFVCKLNICPHVFINFHIFQSLRKVQHEEEFIWQFIFRLLKEADVSLTFCPALWLQSETSQRVTRPWCQILKKWGFVVFIRVRYLFGNPFIVLAVAFQIFLGSINFILWEFCCFVSTDALYKEKRKDSGQEEKGKAAGRSGPDLTCDKVRMETELQF